MYCMYRLCTFPDDYNALSSIVFHSLFSAVSVSKAGSPLDGTPISPYSSAHAGLDITGDGIILDFGDQIAFVRGFRVDPADADFSVSIKIAVDNIEGGAWFWPENAEGVAGDDGLTNSKD